MTFISDEADLPDIPLQAAFDTALAGRSLSATARRALDYAINTTIEHEYAAAADELSLAYYDSAEGFSGGDVLFPGGYGQIVAGLSKDLVRELGAVVTRVTTERAGVGVSLADGRELRAERAIVALPLGVLQSGVVRFSPALPEAKRAALARMGSGVLNKLYLRFPRIFWDRDAELLGYVGERKGAWAEWLNIAFYTGEPLLLAFNAARYGRAVEALDDAAQVAEAMAVLRRIYGHSIPEPSGALASRWSSDPFACGSYSYLPPGARPGDYAALAAPVDGQLFFAGEHTSTENPATVHGALISGRIAAAALIDAA